MARKLLLDLVFDRLSQTKRPTHLTDLCEHLLYETSTTVTPAALHALLRLDRRFELQDRCHWRLPPRTDRIPTLLQVTDHIAQYIRSRDKRFLPEKALAALLADDHNLSPVEPLRLVRQASGTISSRIPRVVTSIFLAQEDLTYGEI